LHYHKNIALTGINVAIHALKENDKPDMPVPTGYTACKVIPGVQMEKT